MPNRMSHNLTPKLRLALLFVTALAVASPAFAQGKSLGKGRGAKAPQPPATSEQAATIAGTGVRHFGMWLDDASFLPKGKGWTTFGVGYWQSRFGHQWDLPSMDAGYALDRRVHVSVNAPYSHASYTDGYTSRGLGDTYLSAKVGIIDPDVEGRTFGLAVAPVVEILSSGSAIEGESRVNWAIPVTVERRFPSFRVYGSGGYFSRGSVFGAGAIEVPLNDRIVVVATLSHSRSLSDDPLADALELGKSRYDLNGALMYVLTPTAAVFGSLGRTISRADANASTLAVSGGISLGFSTVRTKR
ncbi:MAG TPA: hypothetical protein VK886_21920 [Vicinamibacterales bacterium]|nr:hypothetical protein [Vicinamibacterales bacterium]